MMNMSMKIDRGKKGSRFKIIMVYQWLSEKQLVDTRKLSK